MEDLNWSVYIVKCSDGTYYTGITNDIDKRLKLHSSKRGARYTAMRLPIELAYIKKGYTQSEARKEEIILKSWSREKKIKLIKGIIKRNLSTALEINGEVAYEHSDE